MITRVFAVLLVSLLVSPSVWALGQISGLVRNEQGRGLANITVTLTDSSETQVLLTDAFGRYQFASLSAGAYQLSYEDKNFINNTDDDPFPDEGTIYLNPAPAGTFSLQENQNLDLGDVVLQRVDAADNRQGGVTVTDCENYGDGQSPTTLAYALENARQITIQCAGTLAVPEIVIARDVSISAASGLTLEARGRNRVLRVLPGVSLNLSGVDLTRGNFNLGSALFNAGTTSITDADISNNTGDTATVMNAGLLDLRQVTQFSNIITFDSVLRNTGVVTGFDVTIESHVASGGPVISNLGNIELEQCSINGLGTNNVYSIDNAVDSQLKLFTCSISNSGSLFSNKGTLEIFDSSIDGNRGDQSLIESNGVLKIGGTGITNNEVSGLVVYSDGFAEILNSTISSNRAGFSVSGNANNAEDFRGVVSNEGLMLINNSTIASNIHPGFTDRQIGNAGELQMSNSIIVGTGNGEECGGAAAIISQGHNLHADGSCGTAVQSDIPFGNAALLPLSDNGGPGKTHALTADSDAIDAGDCNNGTLSKDQRGVSRPQGSGCDIGAFELEHNTGSGAEEGDTESTDDSESGGEVTGTNESGSESTDSSESESESPENEAGDSAASDNNTGGAETTDNSESSATDAGTDTSNDDATEGNGAQSSGGGAFAGLDALLLMLVIVAYRRRPVG